MNNNSNGPNNPIPDGKIHRYRVEGDSPGQASGAYLMRPDGSGWYQNHKEDSGITLFGQAGGKKKSSPLLDHEEIRRQKARLQREQAKARMEARDFYLWAEIDSMKVAQHQYLIEKCVNTTDYNYPLRIHREALVVPLGNSKGMQTYQLIYPNGTKRLQKGGSKSGCGFLVDSTLDGPICVCEGLATALSLAQCTGLSAYMTVDCHNMLPATLELQKMYPHRDLLICADNDKDRKKGNIGLDKARDVSHITGSKLMVPPHNGDWNDMHQILGAKDVKALFRAYL